MYQLVLMRHGESEWNLQNRFTGWHDVNLTPKGVEQARQGGRLLKAEGFEFDEAYTSVLTRAIRTLWIVMEELDCCWLPVARHWQLNERHYGALTGLNKAETTAKFGEEQVFQWRRGFSVQPPPLESDDPNHPKFDRRYQDIDYHPSTESLADTVERVVPYWQNVLAPRIRAGRRLIVSAHGNSLRALVMHLDQMSEDAIMGLNIPTGVPLVYELDAQLKPLSHRYLGDPDEIAKAVHAVANQAKK